MTIWTIVVYALILSVLVIVHELGHFLVARLFKIKVDEFGIGFPPRLVKLGRWWDTDFVLNWLPFGGYVSLAGEEAPTKDLAGADQSADYFYTRPAHQRFLVILAGPVVNLVVAAMIFMIAYGVWGIPRLVPDAVYIDYLEPDSPAAAADLPVGGQILALVASQEATLVPHQPDEVVAFIGRHRGELVELTVAGDCQSAICRAPAATYSAYVRTLEETPVGHGSLGLALTSYQDYFYPWYQHLPLSVYYGGQQSWTMTKSLLTSLAQAVHQLISGGQQEEVVLMGPVGIVAELDRQEMVKAGFMAILSFAGLLSLNLGIVNLLPIPAVDGGRLVLIVTEKFVGRARVAKIEAGLNYVGLVLIIGLSIIITGADIWRIFGQS